MIARTPDRQRIPAYAEDPAIVRPMIDHDPLGGESEVIADDDGRMRIAAVTL